MRNGPVGSILEPVHLLALLRILKLLAVVMFATGTFGATLRLPLETRRIFAYRLAGPGFGLTWVLGFVYASLLETPLSSTYILASMALSMFSLQVVLYLAGREERGSATASALALLPLIGTLILMVLRPA